MTGTVGEPIQRAYTKGQKRRRPARPGPLRGPPLKEEVRDQVTISRAVIEPENLRWFVLRCAPQKEETIVRVFDLWGIPAAIPTTPREKIRRGKLLKWREPVAPSYVLVGFPGLGPIPWYDVLRFQLVRSIVANHGEPMQVPFRTTYCDKGEIKRGGVETLIPDMDAIRVGAAEFMLNWRYATDETIRIEAGPFAGFEGKVQNCNDRDVSVLISILGRETPLQLSIGDVVKAA